MAHQDIFDSNPQAEIDTVALGFVGAGMQVLFRIYMSY